MTQDDMLLQIHHLRRRVAELEAAQQSIRATEHALRNIERKYQALLDNLNAGAFISDIDGAFLHADPKIAEMAGYSNTEELKTVPAQSLYADPGDRDRLLESLRTHGSVRNREILAVRKDGTTYWISLSAELQMDEDGTPNSILGIVEDISDRKSAEESLRESENVFRSLADAGFEAIFLSEKGICIGQNTAAERMFGYSSEEAIGRGGIEWITPEFRDIVTKNMLSGYEETYEAVALRKDGTTFPCEIQGKMLDSRGRRVRVTALRDISERKRTEAELKASEERFRTIFEGARDGILVVDPRNRKAVLANGGMCRLTGYPIAELLTLSVDDIHPVSALEHVMDQFYKLLAGAISVAEDIPVLRSDGGIAYCDISAGFSRSGPQELFFGFFRDVSDRKKREQELRAERERFETLAENAPFGMAMISADGRFEYINAEFKNLFGYDLSDVPTGKEWLGKAYPEPEYRREATAAWIEDLGAAEKGEQRPRVFTVTCKDGNLKTVHFRPVQFETGQHLMTCEDITERVQGEKRLSEHVAILENILDKAGDGICVCHNILEAPYVRFTHWNPQMSKITGYTREEINELGWYQTLYQDLETRERAAERMTRMRLGDDIRAEESEITARLGELRTVSISTSVIKEEAGTFHVLAIVRDMTERKLDHEILLQRENLLRTILDASPAAITYLEHGAVKWTNPSMLKMFGLDTDSDCLGRSARDFYDSEDEYRRILSLFKESMASGLLCEGEALFRRGDGSSFSGELRIAPVQTAAGKRGLISAIMDISARIRAQEELRAGEENYRRLYEESTRQYELYRSLLDSSPDAVVIYDMGGRVKYVNDAFTQVFGWTLQEILDRKIPYLPESETNSSMELIKSVLEDAIPCSGFETKRLTKDGRLLEVSLSASRYHDHHCEPAGMLVVLSDITHRKTLEEQLRHSGKMEAVGRLAGGVAHDFNNVLTVVIGYANLLMPELPEDRRCQERLKQIVRAAEKAAELTRQLLAFGRKQVLDMKVMYLNEIIADIESLLKRLIGENLDFIICPDPSAGKVQADRVQIQQILMNLVINARDAVSLEGRVIIETANAWLDEDYSSLHAEVEPGEYVMFSVSDDGIGIKPDVAPRIFEPFFTTKEKGVGTGLGLATVYGIVKQHRGHISVYSEYGEGTTFKVYLPRVRDIEECVRPEESSTERAPGKETILIVEDEDIVRQLACEALTMLGYHTLTAANPAEAIDISATYAGRIHLLLTDVVLPQMDGRSLFKKISAIRPDIKVLFASGYTENFIVHHGVLDKDLHFLQKPFNIDNLVRKVRIAIDSPK